MEKNPGRKATGSRVNNRMQDYISRFVWQAARVSTISTYQGACFSSSLTSLGEQRPVLFCQVKPPQLPNWERTVGSDSWAQARTSRFEGGIGFSRVLIFHRTRSMKPSNLPSNVRSWPSMGGEIALIMIVHVLDEVRFRTTEMGWRLSVRIQESSTRGRSRMLC